MWLCTVYDPPRPLLSPLAGSLVTCAVWRLCVPCVCLQFRMLRDIEGQQFSDAVKDKLGPRIAIMGERGPADTLR